MYKILNTITFLFCIFSTIQLQAQSANLSIQGILRTAEGTAVEDGEDYTISFRLYTEEFGSAPLWQETIDSVQVKGGVYSVVLGSNGTPLNVPFDQAYYLGVKVAGGIELIPRAKLTSSPYALSLIGDDNIFPNSGNVGVGAASPQQKLTVQRGDGILGLEAIEDANNIATITTTADGIQLDAGGTDKIYAFNNGRIAATADEQFTVEGTDTAQIIFTNSNGNATLGFDAAGGDDLKLSNPIGVTKIEGNQIALNPTNAPVEINSDGETLQLIGTDSSFLSFYPQGINGGRKGYIGHKNAAAPEHMDIVNEAPNGNMNINTNNGIITMDSHVTITGRRYQSAGGRYFRNSSSYTNAYTDDRYVGLVVTHDIQTDHLWVNSDRRIKKDLELSDGLNDLEMLKKIEVTDYKHIDGVNKGNDFTKGFIAQQVKSIFPEAINMVKGFVPNIYEKASKVTSNGNHFIITMAKPHGLKPNDIVKVIVEDGVESTKVQSIKDEFSFAIFPKEIEVKDKVFVFGKEVDDFHTVEYDKVYTLNVSATQELARQVEDLKKRLAASEQENTILKENSKQSYEMIQNMKSEVETLMGRIDAIEGRTNN